MYIQCGGKVANMVEHYFFQKVKTHWLENEQNSRIIKYI